MSRWYAVNEPQHSLPAVAACAVAATCGFVEYRNSEPVPGRRR
jgi:hypothetical protein